MSVVGNWQKEAARFTPDLPVMVHHGLDRAKGAAFKKQAAKHALVLSSYSLLHRDFDLLEAGALGRRGARRGPEHQEPADQAGAGGAGLAGRATASR